MNIKSLIATVLETIIKVVVLAGFVWFVFRGATTAYDFGYRVYGFHSFCQLGINIDKPLQGSGNTVEVGLKQNYITYLYLTLVCKI